MPKTLRSLQIFVGSPSDVAAERRIALELIGRLDGDPLVRGWRVEPVAWDVTPYARTTWLSPQAAIDAGLPQPSICDICIFIFRHRIGTTLPANTFPPPSDGLDMLDAVPLTGSVWEFRDAMAAGIAKGSPRALVFKGETPLQVPKQRGAERDEVLRQSDAVEDLFSHARDENGSLRWDVIQFDDGDGFRIELDKQLRAGVSELIASKRRKKGPGLTAPNGFEPIPRSYLDWLQRMAGRINLLGLDPKEDRNVGLGDVYVTALTRDRRALEAEGRSSDQPRLIPLLSRLGKDSLYVPGAAGSGKSTFCKWVCWLTGIGYVPPHPDEPPEDFREALPDALRGRLPVLCALRQFDPHFELAQGQDAMSRAQLERALLTWVDEVRPGGIEAKLVERYLKEGRLLLVLDGFDEVPSSRPVGTGRAYPHEALLLGLVDALPHWRAAGNRILLTARPYGLTDRERRDLNLEEDALEPLPGALSQLFIARWFRAVHPDRCEEYIKGLNGQLADNPLPEEILANPMMLTGLCVKFGEGQRLPKDVYELFDTLVSQVLHRRFQDRTQEVEPVRKRLAAVALAMQTGQPAGIPPADATAQARTGKPRPRTHPSPWILSEPLAEIGVEDVDLALNAYADAQPYSEGTDRDSAARREELLSRSGLLLPRADRRAGFYHLYFQDFLAAERMFQTDADVGEYLTRFAPVPQWHQCLLFLFALLASRRSLEVALDKFRPLRAHFAPSELTHDASPAILAGRCLELAHARGACLGDWGEEFRAACLQALDAVEKPPERVRLFESLGRIGLDNRPGVGLDAAGLPDIDWVRIPAGRVVLEGRGGAQDVNAFRIARYPVTWLQYQAFVVAEDGYHDSRWWSGVQSKPSQAAWPISNHPRERVSWYEAKAFCAWFAARLGYEVRLPSEAEWQQAATGGDSAYVYPWGAEYIRGRANCNEIALNDGPYFIGRTTAVGIYPAGASVQGVLDLIGNVWERCQDLVDEAGGPRVMRGGSWLNRGRDLSSAARSGHGPGGGYSGLGFRLART